MKLSEIDATLREIRVAPVKTLGQNFLHDRNLARWIVENAEITKDDYIVEIGPGLGALTQFALAAGAHVLAIEKDARLANFLRERFHDSRLQIEHGDALDFDVRTLFARRSVKCIGNLPYYVSTQLLFKFLRHPSPISLYLFMLQKEMARRLSAAPGTKDCGALTIVMQTRFHVQYLRTVSATVFLPRPEVDSAIVQLTPRVRDELPFFDQEMLMKLVRRGFSQRRKQLQKLLREEIPDWEKAAKQIGFAPNARGEELSVQQWIALANHVRPTAPSAENAIAAERLPVVDKNDRVIRDASRSEVHGDNLRHRAVHVLLFNAADDVYLQQRSRWKDHHPWLWDSSAAGHVNAGEDYDSAAVRELTEELGITVKLKRVVKIPASKGTGEEFIWLYHGRHNGPCRIATVEIACGEFFPAATVSDWIDARPEDFAPGFIECWTAWRKRANASFVGPPES